MSDVVFILGAGASKEAGAPLMADFLSQAQRLLKDGKCNDYQEDFERVFRAIAELQRVHSKAELDLDNLESVFAAFEMAQLLGQLPGTDEPEIPRVVKSMRRVITKTL